MGGGGYPIHPNRRGTPNSGQGTSGHQVGWRYPPPRDGAIQRVVDIQQAGSMSLVFMQDFLLVRAFIITYPYPAWQGRELPHIRTGGTPPPCRAAQWVLATQRAVCLLRSRRRTFFYWGLNRCILNFVQGDHRYSCPASRIISLRSSRSSSNIVTIELDNKECQCS